MSLLDCRLWAAVSFLVMFPVNNSYQSHDVRCEPVAGRISPPPMSQRRLPPFAVKCTVAPSNVLQPAHLHTFPIDCGTWVKFQHFSTCSLKAEQWSWFDLIFIFQKIKSYYNEFLPESHDPNTVQCKSIVDHPSHETDLHNPPFDLWISMNYSHIFRRFISHSEPFEWLVTECCCSKDVGLRHGRWKATKRVLHTLTFLWLLLLFSAIRLENPSTGPQAK